MVDERALVADRADFLAQRIHLLGREMAERQGHTVVVRQPDGVAELRQELAVAVQHVGANLERLLPWNRAKRLVGTPVPVPSPAAADAMDAPGGRDGWHPDARDA